MELAGTFRHNTGPTKLFLPLNDTDLNARCNTCQIAVIIVLCGLYPQVVVCLVPLEISSLRCSRQGTSCPNYG